MPFNSILTSLFLLLHHSYSENAEKKLRIASFYWIFRKEYLQSGKKQYFIRCIILNHPVFPARRKAMEIPASLKIFNIIYECRLWLIIPLAVVWSVFLSMQLYHRKRKAFFITLAALPLVILPIAVATTWSGWHYRMELRDRFAPNTNINQMPPAVHAEYARHDFHPRFRDSGIFC